MRSFFVSSTFRDMQSERDILNSVVFPRLRRRLRSLGEEIESVDLRWGINTMNLSEEESGNIVIRMCVDTIDRCRPYLIVLLGERYGWIPEQHLVASLNDNRLKPFFNQDISITEER